MVKEAYHILVVDDEQSMREMLDYLLTKQGYAVSCAQSGKQSIEMLDEDRFDLMICDIKLGDITGLDVLRASKAKNTEIVVIMISAYVTTEMAVEALNICKANYPEGLPNASIRAMNEPLMGGPDED